MFEFVIGDDSFNIRKKKKQKKIELLSSTIYKYSNNNLLGDSQIA